MSKNRDDLSLQELLRHCVGAKNYLGVYVASKLGGDVGYEKVICVSWQRFGNINLAITMADPKMVELLVELGAEVSIDDVEYAASIYFMTNSSSSKFDEGFKIKRSDNALEILQLFYDIGLDTSSLETLCPMLRSHVSYEALIRFENFLLDLRGAQPEKPEFDFTNFESCFTELGDEYAFDFDGVIECPESLYQKLESGFYGLNPDALYQQVDDSVSEDMVELLGLE